jgi:hypothetical protein
MQGLRDVTTLYTPGMHSRNPQGHNAPAQATFLIAIGTDTTGITTRFSQGFS